MKDLTIASSDKRQESPVVRAPWLCAYTRVIPIVSRQARFAAEIASSFIKVPCAVRADRFRYYLRSTVFPTGTAINVVCFWAHESGGTTASEVLGLFTTVCFEASETGAITANSEALLNRHGGLVDWGVPEAEPLQEVTILKVSQLDPGWGPLLHASAAEGLNVIWRVARHKTDELALRCHVVQVIDEYAQPEGDMLGKVEAVRSAVVTRHLREASGPATERALTITFIGKEVRTMTTSTTCIS